MTGVFLEEEYIVVPGTIRISTFTAVVGLPMAEKISTGV
jgi:hypothetical protein